MRNSEGPRWGLFCLAFQHFLQGEGKSVNRPSGNKGWLFLNKGRLLENNQANVPQDYLKVTAFRGQRYAVSPLSKRRIVMLDTASLW